MYFNCFAFTYIQIISLLKMYSFTYPFIFYFSERQTDSESYRQSDKQRSLIPSTCLFPQMSVIAGRPGWAKARSQELRLWVSHVVGRDTTTWFITCGLKGCQPAENWSRKHTQDLNPCTLIWDIRVPTGIFTAMPNACPSLDFICGKIKLV